MISEVMTFTLEVMTSFHCYCTLSDAISLNVVIAHVISVINEYGETSTFGFIIFENEE